MDKTTKALLKSHLNDALKEGVPLRELLVLLYDVAVSWSLKETRGNQTKAAKMLKMSRQCFGKYAHGKGVPMGCRSYKER